MCVQPDGCPTQTPPRWKVRAVLPGGALPPWNPRARFGSVPPASVLGGLGAASATGVAGKAVRCSRRVLEACYGRLAAMPCKGGEPPLGRSRFVRLALDGQVLSRRRCGGFVERALGSVELCRTLRKAVGAGDRTEVVRLRRTTAGGLLCGGRLRQVAPAVLRYSLRFSPVRNHSQPFSSLLTGCLVFSLARRSYPVWIVAGAFTFG